uniref:Uncharacterized protein n=1 Tax=Oncorhynchus tshawytscha TaxID=74940 RepID=A0AAZ3P553_ONCTS
LEKNPEAQFWTTYQERRYAFQDQSMAALLHKWNLKCLNIPLEKFHANKDQLLQQELLPARHSQSQIVKTQYKINGSKLNEL